jgi:hypothetical protein
MTKVLFLVHCETMFLDGMTEGFQSELAREVYSGGYDRVIALDSSLVGDTDGYDGINERLPFLHGGHIEEEHWSWGYDDPEYLDDDDPEKEWGIEGSSAHGHTWVPYFIREEQDIFKAADCWIAGGANMECLEDWRCVLDHMGIEWSETGAIYG